MRIIILFFIFVATSQLLCQIRYDLVCRNDLLISSKKILLEQIGVCEATNNNDNPRIAEYLASVGLAKNLPYCAAGQYWCFLQAVQILNLPDTIIPIKKTGKAIAMFFDARQKGRKTKYYASDNALIVWKHPQNSNGHIERIVQVLKGGWAVTVAFNTTCSNNGLNTAYKKQEGVCLKKRNIYHPLGKLKILGLIGFVRS